MPQSGQTTRCSRFLRWAESCSSFQMFWGVFCTGTLVRFMPCAHTWHKCCSVTSPVTPPTCVPLPAPLRPNRSPEEPGESRSRAPWPGSVGSVHTGSWEVASPGPTATIQDSRLPFLGPQSESSTPDTQPEACVSTSVRLRVPKDALGALQEGPGDLVADQVLGQLWGSLPQAVGQEVEALRPRGQGLRNSSSTSSGPSLRSGRGVGSSVRSPSRRRARAKVTPARCDRDPSNCKQASTTWAGLMARCPACWAPRAAVDRTRLASLEKCRKSGPSARAARPRGARPRPPRGRGPRRGARWRPPGRARPRRPTRGGRRAPPRSRGSPPARAPRTTTSRLPRRRAASNARPTTRIPEAVASAISERLSGSAKACSTTRWAAQSSSDISVHNRCSTHTSSACRKRA